MAQFISNDLLNRELCYMKNLMSQLSKIVPQSECHRYHLIFRNKIFASYDNLKDFLAGYEEHSKYILCAKYYPLGALAAKIQAHWRGYWQRRTSLEDMQSRLCAVVSMDGMVAAGDGSGGIVQMNPEENLSIIIPACIKKETNKDLFICEEGLGCNNCYACITGGGKPCLNEGGMEEEHTKPQCSLEKIRKNDINTT